MFTLKFETRNAAFDDFPASESARILREIAQKIEEGQLSGKIRDVNGNHVGNFTLNGR